MTVYYYLDGLGCANCGAKIEARINKESYIKSCNLSFGAKKLIIDLRSEERRVGKEC